VVMRCACTFQTRVLCGSNCFFAFRDATRRHAVTAFRFCIVRMCVSDQGPLRIQPPLCIPRYHSAACRNGTSVLHCAGVCFRPGFLAELTGFLFREVVRRFRSPFHVVMKLSMCTWHVVILVQRFLPGRDSQGGIRDNYDKLYF